MVFLVGKDGGGVCELGSFCCGRSSACSPAESVVKLPGVVYPGPISRVGSACIFCFLRYGMEWCDDVSCVVSRVHVVYSRLQTRRKVVLKLELKAPRIDGLEFRSDRCHERLET